MARRKLTDGSSDYTYENLATGAVSRKNDLLSYVQTGAIAEDNPYVNFMSQANSKQDYKAWLKSAADYEAKVADELRQNAYDEARIQDQRAYDRQLTEEQREYESPLAQVQRERAAGLNPDLQGSSGSGGSGSSGTITQQAMPGVHTGQTTTTGELSSPYGTADRVISGLGSAASMISAVSGFAGTVFDLVKGIATFGDYLSMSSSAASVAESNALLASSNAAVASGTVSSRIDEAAASASRAQTAAADERFMLVGRLASGLNGEQTYSDADLSQIIADNGISDDDGSYLRELKRMKDNPEYRKLYDDRIVAARRSSVDKDILSYDCMFTLAHNSLQIKGLQQDIDMYSLRLRDSFLSALEESSLVEDTAEAFVTEASNRSTSASFASERLKNDIEHYRKRVEGAINYASSIDEYIKEMEKKDEEAGRYWPYDMTAHQRQIVRYLRLSQFQLNTILSTELELVRNIVNQMHQVVGVEENSMYRGNFDLGASKYYGYRAPIFNALYGSDAPYMRVGDQIFQALSIGAQLYGAYSLGKKASVQSSPRVDNIDLSDYNYEF